MRDRAAVPQQTRSLCSILAYKAVGLDKWKGPECNGGLGMAMTKAPLLDGSKKGIID